MLAVRRLSLLFSILVFAAAPSAQAATLDLGFIVFTDDASLPSVEVYNLTHEEPALEPGEDFFDLHVEAFGANDVSLGASSLPSLAPTTGTELPWLVDLGVSNPFFGQIARLTLALTFREQRIVATLRSCTPGDEGDGCISLALPGEDCDGETEVCEPTRGGAALLVYREPDSEPVPAPTTFPLVLAGGLAALLRRTRP